MAKFISLKTKQGDKIHFNIDHIICVTPDNSGLQRKGSKIKLVNEIILVVESVEDVLNKIEELK